jgi:protein involved in polysaccharide export with SLBB domain
VRHLHRIAYRVADIWEGFIVSFDILHSANVRFAFLGKLAATLALIATGITCAPLIEPAQAEPDQTAAADAAVQASHYKVGDQLKITFFEKLDVNGDTDNDRRPDRSFHQRMDISGEYMVDEKGTISVPLLGTIEVAGKDEKQVTEELSRPFEKLIGRVGFINIVVKEQQPIYIIGPVKNPGVYKYSPGLTVLHAVALAGGFDTGVTDIWHLVEAVRESQRNEASLDRLKRLLAREAVLKAERDNAEVVVPQKLIALTNEATAKALVDSEKQRRTSELQLQATRKKTLAENIKNLSESISVRRGRIHYADNSVNARSTRLASLQSLQSRGTVTNYVVVQAQSDLADTQDRRQEMLVSISDAEASLDQARQQLAEFTKDRVQKLDGELAKMADEIASLTKTLADGAGLTRTMHRIAEANEITAGRRMGKIEIIRRTPTGNDITIAQPTTPLEAGDLVRISLPQEVTE